MFSLKRYYWLQHRGYKSPVKSPPQETYKKVSLGKIYVYNTYLSLTIYINRFQNVKSEGRIVRSVIQLSFAIGGLCQFYNLFNWGRGNWLYSWAFDVCSIGSLNIWQKKCVSGGWHFSFYSYGRFYLLLSIYIVKRRCRSFLCILTLRLNWVYPTG